MIAEATATDMLTVSCIEDDDGLPALAEEWNALAGDVPFRRWDWLEASWRHFRNAQRSLFTLAVRNDDGKLVGLAPLYRQQTLWQGCVVRLLGSDEACSDYLGVLAAREHEDEVAKQVAYWLAGDGMGRWDLLELNGVDAADTLVRRLTACLEARGHTLHVRNGLNCWRLKLPDHWDDYLATLSRNRRQKCRSILRKTFDNGSAVLHRAEDNDSLQRGLEILVDLHQRRRASIGEGGCFSSEPFRNFIAEIADRFLQQETLRLQWIEIDGLPVAADFSLCGGDCTYGYQCGINPDFDRLRPGTLMMVANLKSAIAQGYREFDFLRGDEDYKLHWGAEPRPSLEIRVVPPHAIAKTRHRLWLTGKTIKHWMKAGQLRMGISCS